MLLSLKSHHCISFLASSSQHSSSPFPFHSLTLFHHFLLHFLLSMDTIFVKKNENQQPSFSCGCIATPICSPSPKSPSPMSNLADQTLSSPLNSDFLHHRLH
ncbi:hypothetical protein JHK85_021916 [Glycine max]|nr:hypothetical protein JHK85_021916 [Glycine max]KAH1051386.1 hypothetical protein GYH30_021342 [Glycine max]